MERSCAAPDLDAWQRAQRRQRSLLKPPGALGQLEDLACWLAACHGSERLCSIQAAITVFAADHGVARHGVSAYPASVTAQMLTCLAQGRAAINVLAHAVGARLTIVDVGVDSQEPPPAGVRNERLARGTADLTIENAMSLELARRAIHVGERYAASAIAEGSNLLIAGEVGIANTTSAACLSARLMNCEAQSVVGMGTGITVEQRQRKLQIVRQAVARSSHLQDPVAVLAAVGGLEIAAMCGFYLEAARRSVPCVLDGVIATAAALMAVKIDAGVRPWLAASHLSSEPAHALALDNLRLRPCIDARMRLGEGTGAALAVPIIRAAVALHNEMGTMADLAHRDVSR